MNNIRSVFYPLHNMLSIERLIDFSGRKLILPFYHAVSDERLAHISNLYPLRSVDLFIKDLEFFCKYFQPVDIDFIYHHILHKMEFKRPVFHLTFDDGLREFYTLIAPVLEKKGIPATVFLNSGFLDNKALFYRYKVSLLIEELKKTSSEKVLDNLCDLFLFKQKSRDALTQRFLNLRYSDYTIIERAAEILGVDFDEYLKVHQPYLNSNEINDLISKGFTFGAHSKDHPYFREISMQEQKNQIKASFEAIESFFPIKDRYFSFPFSDDGVEKQLFDYLYDEENCKLSFGISGLKDDIRPFHLHRIPMEGTQTPAKKLIKSEYMYFLLKQLFNKNRITRL